MRSCMGRCIMVKKYGYSDHKNDILKRVSRAEGQVRGVAKMVEDDKYCIDVLTQIAAAKAALDKVALELIHDHANHCMQHAATDDERSKKSKELTAAISRML